MNGMSNAFKDIPAPIRLPERGLESAEAYTRRLLDLHKNTLLLRDAVRRKYLSVAEDKTGAKQFWSTVINELAMGELETE